MSFQIIEEPIRRLDEHARVPIAFRVESRLALVPVAGGLGGLRLEERAVDRPYIKDYDAIAGEGPADWAARWDLARWGLLAAYEGAERVGGSVLAWDTAGVDRLAGRRDVAALWDLRVGPDHRRRGLGHALFRAASAWARGRGCRRLLVETQNINVPACRFYAAQGCVLAAIDQLAYPDCPDEVQLIWSKGVR